MAVEATELQVPQGQETGALEETNGEVWGGEEIRLVRAWGDRLLHGRLLSNIQLPGRHVPPTVRQAAEAILKAEAELRELLENIAARGPEREALVAKLKGHPVGSKQEAEAAAQLSNFQNVTDLRTARIPEAEERVRAAWDAFNASLDAAAAEWDSYLLQQGQRVAQEALPLLQEGLAKLLECQLIENLRLRQGIFDMGPATPETFSRTERQASIARIINGENRGSEGQQHGLLELVYVYRDVFTPPPKVEPELAAEEELPYPVRARLYHLGRGAYPGRQ